MDQEESSSAAETLAESLIPTEEQENETKVSKSERVTSPRMTKFEKAYILGVRAQQLAMNAPPLVDIEHESDPLKIALKEMKQGKIPFIIRRRLPDNSYEEWAFEEMVIPYD